MNIYTCPTCAKDFKTERSLRSHLNWHKPGYAEKSIAGAEIGRDIGAGNRQKAAASKVIEYHKNPNRCVECDTALPYVSRSNKFCSHSCSGKHQVQFRTQEILDKQRATLLETISKRKIYNFPKTPKTIKNCVICNSRHVGAGKTCSKKCRDSLNSTIKKASIASGAWNPRLHRNGRRKKSYMEEGFELWLQKNGVTGYDPEHHVKRYDEDGKFVKNYFIDFYFPNLKLAIELDGTQHKFTVEKDQDRDSYLSSALGMTVYRIPYASFQKNEWIESVKALMGI